MKTKAIYLTTTLLLTTSPLVFGDSAAISTTDGLQMRYGEPGSKATLSVIQDISTNKHDNIAGRVFTLELGLDKTTDDIDIQINKAKASYTAHDMTQRLPVSTVLGKSFALSTADNGRSLNRSAPDLDLEIGVGQMIGGDYPVGLALEDVLPVLPENPISIGGSWSTEQNTRSLEGWAWASGNLSSQHSVTAIDKLDGHTIISVTSTAQAQLAKFGDGLEYSGDGVLERTSSWRFDATDGRLLSLSMQQSTSGINTLPQGEVAVRQDTKVEYSALD